MVGPVHDGNALMQIGSHLKVALLLVTVRKISIVLYDKEPSINFKVSVCTILEEVSHDDGNQKKISSSSNSALN